MKDSIINQYVSNISYNDIDSFAKKNNIYLDNTALEFIYYNVKNNYKGIIYNPDNIFNDLKTKVDSNTYNKIKSLYNIYKTKYRDFL